MTSPYREGEDEPLMRFRLRTQRVWGEAYGAAAFILVMLLLLTATRLSMSGALMLMAFAVVVPTVWVWRLSSYRIAGGAGELLIFRDRIEVPHARRSQPMRMALDDLHVALAHRKVWFNGISFGEVVNIVLRSDDERRVLAASVFESEERARAAFHALELAKAGRLQSELDAQLLEGAASVRDDYDDELDRMLEDLDD